VTVAPENRVLDHRVLTEARVGPDDAAVDLGVLLDHGAAADDRVAADDRASLDVRAAINEARRLEPGAVVAFSRGPDGAHRVSNPGEEPARIIMISTMRFPEVAEHPDTGTVLSMTGPAEGKSFPEGTDLPFMDTVMAAMQAAKERGPGG